MEIEVTNMSLTIKAVTIKSRNGKEIHSGFLDRNEQIELARDMLCASAMLLKGNGVDDLVSIIGSVDSIISTHKTS